MSNAFEVFSAGTHPAEVRNEAVAVMRELNIDISGQQSKPVSEFARQEFDFVITVDSNSGWREHGASHSATVR